ncbi:hypothetical protein JHK86_053323 [Glycine max]|nr:hypothetical protein JHK86_053323 [Glycine max]
MWALRRASIPLRTRGFNVRASCVKLAGTSSVEEEDVINESHGITYGGFLSPNMRFHSVHNASLNFTVGKRALSSSSTKEEDDLEDGFSELEMPAGSGYESEDLLTSDDGDLSDDGQKEDVEEPPHNEVDEAAKEKGNPRRGRVESKLFNEIMNAQGISLHSVLEKWLEKGNELTREEVSLAMLYLRKRKLFGRALLFSGCCANLPAFTRESLFWPSPPLVLSSLPTLLFCDVILATSLPLTTATVLHRLVTLVSKSPHQYWLSPDDLELNRPYIHPYMHMLSCVAFLMNLPVLHDMWSLISSCHYLLQICLDILTLNLPRLFPFHASSVYSSRALSEWLESKKEFEFIERDYASRLDLIAKLRGLHKAEVYIETIPESCSREIMYRTLLANCVSQNNVKKAEEVFSKMKDLDFPITVFTCNQLLFLYKRNDRKKIADVLLLMENENINPSSHTYSILIDTKGQSKDIDGMDQIVDRMKAQGIEPDINTQAVLIRHYISSGLQDKAETLLKEMEGENLKQNRWLCRILLPLYANLGKVDEVGRIWKVCETNPRYDECLGAIEAWGKLNKIDEAEKVFEIMVKKWKLSSKTCSILLKVYANNKMLMKGKDLIKRMGDGGCRIGPLTWDAIVKLYVQAGEVEKADSVLQKAAQQSQMKPIFSTYLTILEQYANRGDIHNSEKIFLRMKQADYPSKAKMYQVLMNAYINAKVPAYGIRDRLRADSIYPNRNLANQLVQVDGFRKNPVSDLLD